MNVQPDLFSSARAAGEKASKACAQKARTESGFDLYGARRRTLELLAELGPKSAEDLVERLKREGYRGHDDRCFGHVFGGLSTQGKIRVVGHCPRRRGHGTAGGRIWELVR